MINSLKRFIQFFLSENSFVYKFLKNFYFKINNKKIFFPTNLVELDVNIFKKKYYLFNKENFLKLKKDYSFFLISDKR